MTVQAKAQQLQTSSMYDLQGIYHNPSMAGTQATNMVGVSYRTQWSGISGSPKTATVFGSFGMPQHNIGIGGYIYRDETGPTSRTGVALASSTLTLTVTAAATPSVAVSVAPAALSIVAGASGTSTATLVRGQLTYFANV